MCFGCFGYGHTSKGCLKRRTCKTCFKKHPTSLHVTGFRPPERNNISNGTYRVEDTQSPNNIIPSHTCHATHSMSNVVLQAVLPVLVTQMGSNRSVMTYAFYDNGSDGCFITDDIQEDLQATGIESTLKLKTMHGSSYTNTYAINNIIVSDIDGHNSIPLPTTFTKKEIPVSHDQIPRPEFLSQWPHLHPISNRVAGYLPDLSIGILIGSNCPAALEPLQVIPVTGHGPFAALLRHGWTIHGPLEINIDSITNTMNCNPVIMQDTVSTKEAISPMSLLKVFEKDFNDHDIGKVGGQCGPSQEDLKFLKMASKTIIMQNGHYVLPLPFRDTVITMPNNKCQAIKRAQWQKKKMLRDDKYRNDYVTFVTNIIDKGYAAKISDSHIIADPGKVWYLPHHAVYHHKKPDKIRVVFDCSATFGRTSLNDQLLQGPDLTNSLVGVLTRFRQERIAFMSDIEAMFYQVQIPEEQYDFLRFMWWPNGNLDEGLQEYHMKVHLFGAVSSPSISNFALRHITIDHADKLDTEVDKTIKHHFYVDDCLRSVNSQDEAIQLIQNLRSACSSGGFHLTKFTCNDTTVLKTIPINEHSKELQTRNLDYDELPIEHALGIQWSVESDTFGFSFILPNKPLTRRGVLSVASSVYDPLGFIAPFVLPVKKLLQDLCRESILGWDDEIPEDYRHRFAKWLNDIPLLQHINVQRCLKPSHFGPVTSSQIHVFADASSIGYGTAAYLRLSDGHTTHTSFLIGKARLAPLKATSIPRLELTAATVAVRIGQMMKTELDIAVDNTIYHTDSTTVLHYINSEKRRFPVFVANRVQQIRDFSSTNQWRYISTSENPVDYASRGLDGRKMIENTRWLAGPSFLLQPETDWPTQPDLFGKSTGDIDKYDNIITCASISTNQSPPAMDKLINHYSDWFRLKKALSVFVVVKMILQERIKQIKPSTSADDTTRFQPFTIDLIQYAETILIKYVQHVHFGDEINTLRRGDFQRKRGRAAK